MLISLLKRCLLLSVVYYSGKIKTFRAKPRQNNLGEKLIVRQTRSSTVNKLPEKSALAAPGAKKKISGFARRLLEEWKRLSIPVSDAHIVIAVSGGADSTALLLAVSELVKLKRLALGVTVAHLDHELRGETGSADARWVAELTAQVRFESVVERICVRRRRRETKDNLEQAARRARYEFLTRVAERENACAVLAAHTLDDQAETVLLRLMRGSGTEGLGGMRAARPLDANSKALLVRPLLSWARRADTQAYCREQGVSARPDAMNEDERFARVRVRQQLLPLLETFNPRIVETLARTARLLQEDLSVLEEYAAKLLAEASEEATIDPLRLRIDVLAGAPRAVRRMALRVWVRRELGSLRRVELVHIVAIESLLAGERGGRIIELPGGHSVARRRGYLLLNVKNS